MPVYPFTKKSSMAAVLAALVGFAGTVFCRQDGTLKNPSIMTVHGPALAGRMGTTLHHEHVLVDFIGADSTGYHRWDRAKVVEKVLPYLEEIKRYGVQTLIEATPAYLGRDPILLKELSSRSGITLLTNTGYYGARNNLYIPAFAKVENAEVIAARWIREWEKGIENTGVKPGFIKLAVDRDDRLSAMHQTLIRAAAKAHLKTGLVIASHTGPESPAFEQISILEEEGVDPSAFIWIHAQRGSRASHQKAARQGAWVSWDNVGKDTSGIRSVLEFLSTMKKGGLLGKVLLSHDAGWYHVGEANGGTFNAFTPIFTHLIPAMEKRGFSHDDIRQLFERNPREAYTVRIRPLRKR